MGLDLRLPNITATTEREQLVQIKSYLYQLASQLQWALNTIETPSSSQQVVNQTPRNVIAQAKEESAEVTFNSLKALIIKSADIVNAYYEEINTRLSGVYVAESDFGTYIEETNQTIRESSTGIERNFTNIQKIITDIENLNFSFAESQAHIRSGILYYDEDELPVYGLEIGQRNKIDGEEVFNKYARFTSDRLSFYDQNDTEIAYISDYKLHINHAEVLGTLKIGGYLIDTTKGLTFKWVGRG
jgi:hypothetical protein